MFKEFPNLRQHDDSYRRLFFDDFFDLYAWYDQEGGRMIGFQLVYDKRGYQRSLTWTESEGYRHNKIDEGERAGTSKMTPILVPDGVFDAISVSERFERDTAGLDREIYLMVSGKLAEFDALKVRKYP
ncbi:MAG: hypothetical protein E4H20_04035 [Spirochaetales bacterium]|nr:MAG: hypothetical protein E4H20_04035 [Spirochaetales bacterium]